MDTVSDGDPDRDNMLLSHLTSDGDPGGEVSMGGEHQVPPNNKEEDKVYQSGADPEIKFQSTHCPPTVNLTRTGGQGLVELQVGEHDDHDQGQDQMNNVSDGDPDRGKLLLSPLTSDGDPGGDLLIGMDHQTLPTNTTNSGVDPELTTKSTQCPPTVNLARTGGQGLENVKSTQCPPTVNLTRIGGQGLEVVGDESVWSVGRRIRHTRDEVGKMMNSIFSYLNFTTELQTDYPEDYMPTLDISIKMRGDATVSYRFFEK